MPELKSYLLKWVDSDDYYLNYISSNWDKIPKDLRGKSPKVVFGLFPIPSYSEYSNEDLAKESQKWLIPEKEFSKIEAR